MKIILNNQRSDKRQSGIIEGFLSLPFQAAKKNRIYCLLITVLGLFMLTASLGLLMPRAVQAEISITVTGNGVANPVTFSQADLEALEQVQATYSTINTWPTKMWYVAEGVRLANLLNIAQIKDDARLITVKSVDGYRMTFTRKELLEDERYYFPGLKENAEYDGSVSGSPENAVPVDAILALMSAEATKNTQYMNNQNAPLLVFGQRWVTEQTNHAFTKCVSEIQVSTAAPAKWANPTATPVGGTVYAATQVTLASAFNDSDKVYYTTDGTDPTCHSPMFNWIASRWWGSRRDEVGIINKPIELTRDTVIKAKTIGIGKEDSDIVTFHYQVPLATAPMLTADSNNTVGEGVCLTFADDPNWRAAVRAVSVNGSVLAVGQYAQDTPGEITINSDVFNTVGQYLIVITALGYTDATVTQTMSALVNIAAPAANQQFTRGQQVGVQGTAEGSLTSLTLCVTDPDGQIIHGPKAVEVVNGHFETSFTLGASTKIGTCTITLEGLGMPNTITRTFTVKEDGVIVPPVGDVVLTITGNGLAKEVKLTRAELQNMQQCQQVYSAINTWPTKKWYVGKGVKLRDLLDLAGINGYQGLIKFTSADGYTMQFTAQELLNDTRYYFPNFKGASDGDGHVPGSSAGAQTVEPIVALLSAEGTNNPAYMNDLNALMFMMGQRAVTEQTGQLFVKNLSKIEVLSAAPPRWDTPQADPGSGEVPVGTKVKLSNANMDDDKIYYTTDGSIPTINSPMYNWIANRWWSSRSEVLDTINHPIEIKEDTIIKAITIGPGKTDSEVAVFTYKAGRPIENIIEKVIPGKESTISMGTEATILIPADALKEAVEVKIDKVAAPPAVPTGFKLLSRVYEFSVDGKNNYTFAKSITVTLSFDPKDISEGETPTIHFYDQARGEWVNIGGTVSENTITVQVEHFTKFAVLAMEKAKVEEPEKKDEIVILTDINGHWAQKNIEQLVGAGVIGGYPDGTFKPDNTITRAEFVAMLVKAFKLENQVGRNFADSAAHWAKDYIARAAAGGIVTGYDNDTFGPDDPVTREQMAVMIVKAAKLSPAPEELRFADSGSISPWARVAMTAAASNGMIKGYLDNTVRPQGNATRAEVVTVIVKALREYGIK